MPTLVPNVERNAGDVRPISRITSASSSMVRPSPPYSSEIDRPKRPRSRISCTIFSGIAFVSDTSCSFGRHTSLTNRRTVSISCCRVSRSSAILVSSSSQMRAVSRMCESILSTACSTVSTGSPDWRAQNFCHPQLVRRGDRRGSSNWMSPLVSLIGQALSVRGATSTGSGVRRARRTLHSGGIQDRTSSRKRERMWARPQLRGGRKVG